MVQKMKLGFSVNLEDYPELTNDLLEELRRWAQQHGVREIPQEQLLLFAHSCFFDAEATKRCMHTYYRMRTTVPEFFAKRNPRSDELQFSLKALRFAMLPVPDPQGNRIIFHRLGDTRPHQYMFDDGIKLLNMTADASIYKHGVSPGYIFLFDMQGVRLGHLMRLSISSIRRFFEYLQDGMPVRLKGIHVLNAVWFMDKVLALIRPFMKRELFETLHLYRNDVSEIYKHIPEDCLPSDFGGKLDSIDQLHANFHGQNQLSRANENPFNQFIFGRNFGDRWMVSETVWYYRLTVECWMNYEITSRRKKNCSAAGIRDVRTTQNSRKNLEMPKRMNKKKMRAMKFVSYAETQISQMILFANELVQYCRRQVLS